MEIYGDNDVGVRRQAQAAGASRRQAGWAMAIFVLMALLLNAEAIHDVIARKPYGRARQVGLVMTAPLAEVSRRTGLAWGRRLLEQVRERWEP